jgi:hypothetical protein
VSLLLPGSFYQLVATETAAQGRLMVAGCAPTQGVVGAGDLVVSQNGTPNMSVNVAAGSAFIAGTSSSTQGTYHATNDATVNLAIAAADPTNPRIDLVILEILDAFYSGANNKPQLRVVTGTPAGSPVAPPVSGNVGYIILAQVAIAALAGSVVNANITDKRPRGASLGGPLSVASSAEVVANPYAGMPRIRRDAYALEEYTTATTGWQPPWNLPWGMLGWVALSGSATSAPTVLTGTLTVAPPANRRLRIHAQGAFYTSTDSGTATIRIRKAASNLALEQSQSAGTVTSDRIKFDFDFVDNSGSSGSRTYDVQATLMTGTARSIDPTLAEAFLTVEDVGPAANPV